MKILMVGDVIGQVGIDYLRANLKYIKEENDIDYCIVNGENSTDFHGITRRAFDEICESGADMVTLGNHTWHKKDIFALLESGEPIIRPANYPEGTCGSGVFVTKRNGKSIAVVSLMGRIYMDPLDCPFTCFDKLYEDLKDKCDIILVDFHAEATSEKVAFGWHVNGRATAVFGTHTHIQTADERILTKGTAYITDVGMTGPYYSVLGVERQSAITRFITRVPQGQRFADGAMQFNAVIVDINDETNKAEKITRLNITD